MAGLLSNVVGGALQGLGDSMVQQANDMRQQRLLELQQSLRDASDEKQDNRNHGFRIDEANVEHGFRSQEQEQNHGFELDRDNQNNAASLKRTQIEEGGATSRQAAGFAHDDTELTGTTTDASGNVVGISRTGKAVQTGIKADKTVSASQKDLMDRVENEFTVSKPIIGADGEDTGKVEKTLNVKGVAGRLRDLGHPELAKIYDGGKSAPSKQAPAAKPVITNAAKDFLKSNPNTRSFFDQKYGAGAAASVLGN
jgi:hypothetical protein